MTSTADEIISALPVGYVYLITSKKSNLGYVGIHQGHVFDKDYFGSPTSKVGLLKEYQDLWPGTNSRGYKHPSSEAFLEHFSSTVLEWCSTVEELFTSEIFWIKELDTYKNGLNRNAGSGAGSPFGPSYEKFCSQCSKVTKWKSSLCYSCTNKASKTKLFCKVHNEMTVHHGESCLRCALEAATTLKLCEVCLRETKHRGDTCQACVINKMLRDGHCEIHGASKFTGQRCRKCISISMGSKKFCVQCSKETSHTGDACRACYTLASTILKECPKHGLVLHRGEMCYTCTSQSSQNTIFCGSCNRETPHRGSHCMNCSAKKSFSMKNCEFCSKETNHRGSSCMVCSNKSNHTRTHKKKKLDTCQLCTNGVQVS